MAKPKENGKTAALVLGMHRSGTSCFTRCLNILGYSIPKTLIGMDHTNKTGHWESYKIARLNDAILEKLGLTWSSWDSVDFDIIKHVDLLNFKEDIKSTIKSEFGNSNDIVIKEPRICRTASAYIEALEQLNYTIKIFVIVRNPLEVVESLGKRNGISTADAALLWLRYNLDAEFASRKHKRIFISFSQLVKAPVEMFEFTSANLSVKYPQDLDDVSPMLVDFVNPSQRNHLISNEEVSHSTLTMGWINDVYSALLVLCNNPDSRNSLEVLDRVRREFDTSSPNLSQIAEFKEKEYSYNLEKLDDRLREEKELRTKVTASFSEQEDVIATLKNEVSALQKSLSESEDNKSELASEYEKLEKELRNQAITSNNELHDLQNALSETEAIKGKLTFNYDKLEKSIVDKDQSLDEIEVELTRAYNALSLSESHIESLVSDLKELEDLSERKSSVLKKRLKAQRKKREKAKKALSELRLKFNDVYTERTILNQKLSELETELDALKSDYEKRLNESQEAYEQVLGERGQLEATLAVHGQEFMSLKRESEALRQALAISQEETVGVQSSLVEAKQALAISQEETMGVQSSLVEAKQALAISQEETMGVQSSLVEVSRNFNKIKLELQEAGADLKALRRSKRRLQKDKWNLQDQVRVFNDRIEAYRDSTSWRLTKPIRVLKRALRAIKQKSFGSKIKSKPPLSVSHGLKSKPEDKSNNIFESKIDLINKSNLFDEAYYCTQYPIVEEHELKPVEHYVTHGWKLGFNPNDTFNSLAYIAANQSIKGSEICPLVHFIENHSNWVEEIKNESLEAPANYGKIVVFTAVSGGYDELRPPLHVSKNADYIYFSEEENPDLTIWQYRRFDYFDVEPSRMSRFVKTHPHIYFENYDWAIWVDANIQLNCKPEDLIRAHVNKNNLIMFSHPYRDCAYQEAQECIKRNKDTSNLLSEQISRYKSLNFPANVGLYETGVTISKPNDLEIIELMNIWWREILMGSKRDQISLPFALKQANVKLGEMSKLGICVRTDPRFVYFKHL